MRGGSPFGRRHRRGRARRAGCRQGALTTAYLGDVREQAGADSQSGSRGSAADSVLFPEARSIASNARNGVKEGKRERRAKGQGKEAVEEGLQR